MAEIVPQSNRCLRDPDFQRVYVPRISQMPQIPQMPQVPKMEILEIRALRGPNRYSRYKAIFMLLDIGELEESSSKDLPGFNDRLLDLLPSLESHGCSLGRPGGFIERLRRGTWAGHVVEHVALELQCLVGQEVAFGKTRGTARHGIYTVVYRYVVESVGLKAGRDAVAVVEACISDRPVDVEALLDGLRELRERDRLGPSTASIVEEAKSRGIPVIRLNQSSFIQLGYGARQRRVQATMTDRTSALGVEIADEKARTKELLAAAGIPVPRGILADDFDEALAAAEEIGWPVVVKPEIGNHGRGITVGLENPEDLATAFAAAKRICRSVLVEKRLVGFDFRLLTIGNQLIAAALREPAHVVGDGRSTVAELVERSNADPRRGFGHERVLTRIEIDPMSERLLQREGLEIDSVLAPGRKLYLKSTANLSTGATARDVTDEVHPQIRFMAERAARIVGLDCMGIDIVAPGLDVPLDPRTSGVVEVNAAPGFRMHLAPTEGQARKVAAPLVDMLFPPEIDFAVPIVAITGTNGKTTTAKLIAHTLKYSGHHVGFAGTTGVEIDGYPVVFGDHSGPEGTRIVLQDPTVDHAVLEIARGGILRRGLAFGSCAVGVLLNIAEDHIGNDLVDTVEEMQLVKSTVVEIVEPQGTAVLNADDELTAALAERARGQLVFFSLDEHNPLVREHVAAGGTAVLLCHGRIVIRTKQMDLDVLQAFEAPITFGGLAAFNTANMLAAVAALHGLGMPVENIRAGVMTFHASTTQNPGRMNMIDFRDFRVLLDYGHNVPAVKALGALLGHLAAGRKIVVAHGTGSRSSEAIRTFGAALAAVYDEIVITDLDPRSRPPGETSELVRRGALEHGFAERHVHIVNDPSAAIDRAFSLVAAEDILVIQVDEIEPMMSQVMALHQRHLASEA